jgi:hypothetical protein
MPTTPRELEALMAANGGLIPIDVLKLMVASLGLPHPGGHPGGQASYSAALPRGGSILPAGQMPPPPSFGEAHSYPKN